jgi:hypothetical protein
VIIIIERRSIRRRRTMAQENRTLLEKAMTSKLMKIFPAICGKIRFVFMFTRTYHWCAS